MNSTSTDCKEGELTRIGNAEEAEEFFQPIRSTTEFLSATGLAIGHRDIDNKRRGLEEIVDYNRLEIVPYQWNGLEASFPVNQYWHTNFPASQRGYLKLPTV